MRPHRHEVWNADPVQIGHICNFGDADGMQHGACTADRDARLDAALDTRRAVLSFLGAEPMLIGVRFGQHLQGH